MDFGTCTVHSWNDSNEDEAEPKMGWRVDEKLRPCDTRDPRAPDPPNLVNLFWDRDR